MSLARIYVRKRKAIIPTVAQVQDGFFIDVEPVEIVKIDDARDLKASIERALSNGNPKIPTPERASEPGSVILEAVGIRRWEAFEKGAALYTVQRNSATTVLYVTGRAENGMWREAKDQQLQFPAAVPMSVIADAIVESILQRPDLLERESSLPMLLPPSSAP